MTYSVTLRLSFINAIDASQKCLLWSTFFFFYFQRTQQGSDSFALVGGLLIDMAICMWGVNARNFSRYTMHQSFFQPHRRRKLL